MNKLIALFFLASITAHGQTLVRPSQGGTGVSNNGASTITISGAHPVTFTLTGSTNVTVPVSGTLAADIYAWAQAATKPTYTYSEVGADPAGAAAAVTPTTLGLVIGTNVQAYNSNLTAINQALTTTSSPSFASMGITGTGGLGYIDFAAQSSNPSAPAAGIARFHASTANGFTRLELDNEAATNVFLPRDSVTVAKNTSGSQINKGQVVRISGSTGNAPNIALAKADSGATLPAVYVAIDNIADNNFGQVMRSGIVSSFDTSALSVGPVWVSATTAGALTSTRPSGTTNAAQRVGTVLVSGVGNGSIDVNIAPAVLNMETGTNAATWTGTHLVATDFTGALIGNASTATSAGKWTAARTLAGNSVDGSANVAFANKFISQGTTDAGLSSAQFLGALGTGIVKNTATTGVLSIAVAGDFPTMNQNTTGTADNVTITDDVTSASPEPILWRRVVFGDVRTSAASLYYVPSTGVFSAPSFSGAGTGLTGTAASLTAGNVTTNANLTGVVISSGNATSFAASPIFEATNLTTPAASFRYSSAGAPLNINADNGDGHGYLALNASPVSSSSNNTYTITAPAGRFDLNRFGGFNIWGAASGTAGNTITWTSLISGTQAGAITIPGALAVTGHTTFEGVTSTGATGSGKLVYDTSPTFATSAISPLFRSTGATILLQGTGTGATQVSTTQTTPPTCSSNCGTSPSVVGTDTDGTVTLGATGTPATGWVVTFNGTWAAAPSCVLQMAKAGMVIGKVAVNVPTTTTTFTVNTGATAPGNSDMYHYHCMGVL